MLSEDPRNVESINAPFSRASASNLGNSMSHIVKLSLDDPDKWCNSIYENSRYATFIWHTHDNKVTLISSGLGMSKFRKQTAKSLAEFYKKINKYISYNVEFN